ncbi:hypothetical protein EJ08DRAFT_649208 [Tothia fuscella]|uniref:Endosomal peripheral membrane protein n=1 Tax=Tothia fuscella TaxID=1048955 RepID=A0A9P4NT07_9PEZI|nr:hypothetical protein EJ08DRAFT_649208 [Tothia fuscella]
MTAQILSTELTGLIQETKRKLPDLRKAAENSLQELKALPTTSEAQLSADLSRRPQFIEPFLIACTSKSTKYAVTGISCLQRLAIISGLPKTRLKEVLDATRECSGINGLEIQLKVLQILPSLQQNYSDDLRGSLIFTLLQTCSILQSSKTPSVSSTAAATLQQLISGLFERLSIEDGKSLELPTVAEVEDDKGMVPVRAVAYDACRIFQDICVLTEGGKPQNVRFSPMPETTSLELIEAIFVSHAEIIANHPELSHIIRVTLLPYLIEAFTEKKTFPVILRITRLMYLIIHNHLDLFPDECETMLESFNRVLDLGEAAGWKRVLCMEVLRGIFSESRLLLRIYSRFDEQENGKPILRTSMNGFVRLASEKPSLIGLGQQSTIPVGNYFQRESSGDTSNDSNSMASKAEGTAGVGMAAVPGISNQWSSMRAPCIDQLDKTEPPSLPETYIYSLVLSCLNNLAECLAKFILPLTVHSSGKAKKRRGTVDSDTPSSPSLDSLSPSPEVRKLKRTQSYKKRTVPSNPLQLDDHPASQDVHTVAVLIEECWPAILASCSTFFYASLDSDHYRALVRSYQKFAQVAGLLRMATPRDAFLTTLSKAAVPPHILAATFAFPSNQSLRSPSILDSAKELLSVESLVSQASTLLPDRGGRRGSFDAGEPSLSSRNLLCLRALLNIAIALGPTLESSWSIVFETLQQADKVMASLRPMSRDSRPAGQPAGEGGQYQVITSEMNAVQAAVSRLFESTADFPNESFVCVLQSLCKFLDTKSASGKNIKATPPPTPGGVHRRVSSFPGISINTDTTDRDFVFALAKIRELISGNIDRFITYSPATSGWDILTSTVTAVATQFDNPTTGRLLAAELLCRLARDTVSAAITEDEVAQSEVQCRSLEALLSVCRGLGRAGGISTSLTTDEASDEVHSMALDTLRAILEQIGDTLVEGWPIIFDVFTSVFVPELNDSTNGAANKPRSRSSLCSIPLGRSSFASVQLICSDFLNSVPDSSLLSLVDTIFRFCSQTQDVNMALTTTTLFWNLSDLLYSRTTDEALNNLASEVGNEADVLAGEDLFHKLLLSAEQKSMPALWLLLLRRLTDTIADHREEVRTGALQTILRIFDNHGEDLSPDSWQLCLHAILLPMLREDARLDLVLVDKVTGVDTRDEELAEIKGRITTSRLLLDGTSKLFASYLPQIVQCPHFAQIWEFTTTTLSSYLDCHLHDINAAVYAAFTTILSSIDDTKLIGMPAVQKLASIWASQFPTTGQITTTHSNHGAFETYLQSLKAIYRLIKETVTLDITQKIAENLEQAIIQSDSPSYSSDVDVLTSVQRSVMECLRMLRTDLDGVPSILVGLLARFTGLPFQSPKSEKPSKLTFIALSKASMDLVQGLTAGFAAKDEIYPTSLLLTMTNLEKPIGLKYQWSLQGKAPPLWQKATSTLLAILEHTVPRIFDVDLEPQTINDYWEIIVRAAQGIAHADIDSAPNSAPIFEDEDFDIASLTKLSCLIIPSLGSNIISVITRRAYTRALFESSLIHKPEPGELPDLDSEPTKDIYNIRFGRTYNPEPNLRGMMAYHCLGDLISLVSTHDSSPQRIKLAQAASPYLILRAALPLKAYIADQPLRGRYMPQPDSERQELLFVLKEMRMLESESAAIPEAEGVKSEGKRHLVRLYGLVVKALEVAGGTAKPDGELIGEMRGWLEGVGEEFKI